MYGKLIEDINFIYLTNHVTNQPLTTRETDVASVEMKLIIS